MIICIQKQIQLDDWAERLDNSWGHWSLLLQTTQHYLSKQIELLFLRQIIVRNIFSAECTTGMVWGLTFTKAIRTLMFV